MALKGKKNKNEQTVTEQDILDKIAQKDAADEYTGIPEAPKSRSFKDRFVATPGEVEKQTRNDSAVQTQMRASDKADTSDDLSIDEDRKFGEGARQMKKNVEKWKEDVAREKKEFEDAVNKEPGADTLAKSGDELKDQINQQVGAVKGQVDAPAQSVAEGNPEPTAIEENAVSQEEMPVNELAAPVGEEPKALTPEQQYEKAQEDAENNRETANESSETDIDPDFYKKYVDEYYGPKNGADYLKSLWSQGAGGKAAAIGNVLGNLMGAAGKGAIGQDYETDWQKYKDNYIKAQSERNQRAFNDNMDIVKQVRQNDVARGELVKTMELMKKLGHISAEDFEAIRKGMASTGKSSQMDYFLATVLGSLAGNKDFTNALSNLSESTVNILGNLANIGSQGLNWLSGWGRGR